MRSRVIMESQQMSLTTKVGFLAGATATTIAGAAFAGTSANVSYEDLQQRLDAAEAKIAELSTTQNADWLTEQRADDIRGLVQDVLADADTRASLRDPACRLDTTMDSLFPPTTVSGCFASTVSCRTVG